MPRAFTEHERALLLRLVSGASDEALLRAQVDVSQYGEAWFEGSQSFTIVPADGVSAPSRGSVRDRAQGPRVIVVEDGAKLASGANVVGGMFLWLEGRRITDLEYWWVTDDMPDHLPDQDQLIDER